MKITEIFDILQKLFTILAIIGGGVWTYFHYFRRRAYRLRLEPMVSGSVIYKGGTMYLVATARLKNLGLSKAKIEQRGTAMRIHEYSPLNGLLTKARTVKALRIATFPVFEQHGWIESGEIIEDQRLVAIPSNDQIGFEIELRIVSRGIYWRTSEIVKLPAE